MPLTLPSWPGPASVTPRPITSRNEHRPAFGGPVTRNLRPGTRWAWDFVMPPMTYVESLDWDAILSEDDTVRIEIPQPGFDTGPTGAPVTDETVAPPINQSGRYLAVKNMTPSYVVKQGQWLSVEVDGQLYAYKVRETRLATWPGAPDVTFSDGTTFSDGSRFTQDPIPGGLCLIQLLTMIRKPIPAGTAVNLAQPMVEGFATVDPSSLEIGTDGFVRLRFTIEERE